MCAAAVVIKTLPITNKVGLCVTSVDDQLFVLLERTEKQVAVFSLNDDYKLLSRLHVPDFRQILPQRLQTTESSPRDRLQTTSPSTTTTNY